MDSSSLIFRTHSASTVQSCSHVLRILVVDEECAFRELLQSVLHDDTRQVETMGGQTPRDSVEADLLDRCISFQPDLLIFDPFATSGLAAKVVQILRRRHPALRILLTPQAGQVARQEAVEAIRAGAQGCVFKTESLDQLRIAINLVAQGASYFSPQAQVAMNNPASTALRGLSHRQREVLRMIAEGFSTKEISRELNLSVKTAAHHRLRLMKKLELHDPVSVARFALATGLVRL